MSVGIRGVLRLIAERWALPQRCLFCGTPDPREGICGGCREELPGSEAVRCPTCGNLSPLGEICGECLARPPRFSRLSVAASYRFPVDAAIQRLKYGADLTAARPLAALLAERVDREPRPDFLLAMPMAPQRLRERGFNQADELARAVSERLSLKLASRLCRRTRHTAPQAVLPWAERRRNIRKAFACDADLSGSRVAVVDDVLTTGATLDELAGVLLGCGATQVWGWVVARAERA
jgi:ComF family protein